VFFTKLHYKEKELHGWVVGWIRIINKIVFGEPTGMRPHREPSSSRD
jgi:hypothetical protein